MRLRNSVFSVRFVKPLNFRSFSDQTNSNLWNGFLVAGEIAL